MKVRMKEITRWWMCTKCLQQQAGSVVEQQRTCLKCGGFEFELMPDDSPNWLIVIWRTIKLTTSALRYVFADAKREIAEELKSRARVQAALEAITNPPCELDDAWHDEQVKISDAERFARGLQSTLTRPAIAKAMASWEKERKRHRRMRRILILITLLTGSLLCRALLIVYGGGS